MSRVYLRTMRKHEARSLLSCTKKTSWPSPIICGRRTPRRLRFRSIFISKYCVPPCFCRPLCFALWTGRGIGTHWT
jgi:hypothetical protein